MALGPNAIVYLRRNDLIVGGKHITPGKLKFTSDLLENLELQDPNKFIEACSEFFSAHNLQAKKVLIVLDQSVVFEKLVSTDDPSKGDINYITDNFIASMPYTSGQRSCIKFEADNQLHLYATNADLYRAISDALDLTGIRKLTSVTPAVAYSIDFGGKSSDIIEQFISDKKVRNKINFSTVSPL